MTAPVRQQKVHICDPLEAFIERAKVKALAWQAGEISLHDAVDGLQQTAEALGLVIELGQDAVQALMVEAFAPLRTDLECSIAEDAWSAPGWREAAIDYHEARGKNVSIVSYTPDELARLRRLMDDDILIEQAWEEMNIRAPGDVPIATLQAAEFLMQVGDEARWRKWFDAQTADDQKAILDHLEARRRRRK